MRPRRTALSLAAAVLVAGAGSAGLEAAEGSAAAAAVTPEGPGSDTVRTVGESDAPRRAWTFPAGEHFTYSARFGRVKVGQATLAVEAVDTVEGTPAYRLAMSREAGVPFCKIDDREVSWVSPRPLRTLRYEQHYRQCGGYELDRRYAFDHSASPPTWTMINMFPRDGDGGDDGGSGDWRLETVKTEPTAVNAIDQVAYLYLARMIPLEVGRTYRFDRYFQEDGNPVVLKVLRRETVRVPAGEFETVVIRPIIQTEGAFSEGGEAEVYITDDERRIPVQIKASMSIGSVNMYLRKYDLGGDGPLIDAGSGSSSGSEPASPPGGESGSP